MDQIAAISFSLVLFYAQTNGFSRENHTRNPSIFPCLSHSPKNATSEVFPGCYFDDLYIYIYLLCIYIIHIYSEIGETIYIYTHTFTPTEPRETTLSRSIFQIFRQPSEVHPAKAQAGNGKEK
jgi:hypothetical protein